MIRKFMDEHNRVWVEVRCGCCYLFFDAPLGGTCFCDGCLGGRHPNCSVAVIMGKSRGEN